MKKQYDQVKQFHAAAGIEMPEVPTMLSRGILAFNGRNDNINSFWANDIAKASKQMKTIPETGGEVKRRASFMLEEIAELLEAQTIEDQADALTDLLYFTLGTFTLMGINPEPVFDIVARANLGKIVDGKVLRNEQGKIMKPDGWHEKHAPEREIKEEIERQAQGK